MHEGHRNRLKKRFLIEGLDNFEQVNALELLLFYCVPRRDTNELAHMLLERFGSINQVFDAPYEELVKVQGVSDNVATFLKLMPDVARYYAKSKEHSALYIQSSRSAAEIILPYYIGQHDEVVYVMCLDMSDRLICVKRVSEGSVTNVGVNIRKITEIAILCKAAKIILFHNHPGGLALPSGDDIAVTDKIKQGLALLKIILKDHIIVSDGDYVSLKDSGFFN